MVKGPLHWASGPPYRHGYVEVGGAWVGRSALVRTETVVRVERASPNKLVELYL